MLYAKLIAFAFVYTLKPISKRMKDMVLKFYNPNVDLLKCWKGLMITVTDKRTKKN